ncbi:MAG: hypothetical protein E7256_12080 [Lachnospiraceae bacterium]|nr:hypothetical protein [Lachnospiraceae bacterium]
MINDLKLGIKLLKYSSQRTLSIILAIVFFIAGVACAVFFNDNIGYAGLFILSNAMWPVQLLYSINASNQVQSSSSKKKLQTTVPAIMYTGCELILYTFYIILQLVVVHLHPEYREMLTLNILFTGISVFFLAIYTGTAYKYFFVSFVLFLTTYLAFSMFGNYMRFHTVTLPLSLPVTIILGYVLVIAGGALQYMLYVLFYKRDLSKYAQGAAMRKCM